MTRPTLRSAGLTAALVLSGVAVSPVVTAHAAGTSTISGTVFQDTNRNGQADAGEAPFSGRLLLLFDANGTNIASAQTDASGRYSFGALADGGYRVAFSTQDWWELRSTWVPTTTGSLHYSRTVSLTGGAVADLGHGTSGQADRAGVME